MIYDIKEWKAKVNSEDQRTSSAREKLRITALPLREDEEEDA